MAWRGVPRAVVCPGADLGARRRPAAPARGRRGRDASADVQPGRQRPEVRRDLRGELEAHLARGEEPGDAARRRATRTASAPSATNAWATATVASPSLAETELDVAGERGTAGNPASSDRNATSSSSGFNPACSRRYDLEEHGLAEDDRGVGLVRAEATFRGRRRSRSSWPGPAGRPGRPWACWSPLARRPGSPR